MTGFDDRAIRRSLKILMCVFAGIFALNAQHLRVSNDIGVTTQQRLESETWWPTMSTLPSGNFVGTAGCVGCHSDMGDGRSATASAMARAASRTGSNEWTLPSSEGKFESGDLRYLLHSNLDGPDITVSRGSDTVSQKLDWVMGSGELGKTFVYEREGRWFQSRLSEYRVAPRLDVTTGLTIPTAFDAGSSLDAALGKTLTTEEIRHCFSCHTVNATSSKGFNPAHAEAGLGCEACHGPGASHSKSADAKTLQHGEPAIFNPAKLDPADSIDFCGACHRTFGDVTQAANPANDSSVVRFQPYRLERSRCWRETEDARLTCVACHDPHAPLVRNDTSYDKNCLRCHASGVATTHAGKACPTGAKTQCVSCHMQKVKVASMHGEFTDHFIRVVKAGEGFQQ